MHSSKRQKHLNTKKQLYTKVYRLENSSGDGPFQSNAFLQRDLEKYWVAKEGKILPQPNEDRTAGPIFESGKYHCGCESKAVLERWFKPKLGELKQRGFQIVKYKVRTSQLGRGKYQVWFNRKSATYLQFKT